MISLGELKNSQTFGEQQLTYRSPDGQTLMLCSSDGYCSIVVFDLAELGTVHPTQQHHRQLAAIAQSHSHSHSSAMQAAMSTPTPTPPASTAARDPTSLAGTPAPLSPAVSSAMRQSPAPGNIGGSGSFSYSRSEREGSTSSSLAGLGPSQMSLPMFQAPASTASSTTAGDAVFPDTPADEMEGYTWKVTKVVRSESESTNASMAANIRDNLSSQMGLGLGQAEEIGAGSKVEKRPAPVPATSSSTSVSAGEVPQDAGAAAEDGGAKKKRRVALTHLGSDEQ